MLHQAAKYGHINVARLLIKKGANLEAETNGGETALRQGMNGFPIIVLERILQLVAFGEVLCLHCFAKHGAVSGGGLFNKPIRRNAPPLSILPKSHCTTPPCDSSD